MTEFACGDVTIRDLGKVLYVSEGQTVSRVSATGSQRLFDVTGRGPIIKIKIAFTTWDNGEQDVRAIEVQGPQAVRRLEKGALRLGIKVFDRHDANVELRQARVKVETQNFWSNLYSATPEQLDEGAGFNAFSILRSAGAKKIGTKEDLLGCSDKTRGRLCAVFQKDNSMFPVVVFALTRVLPLRNHYSA
jgi:hypothetical protein